MTVIIKDCVRVFDIFFFSFFLNHGSGLGKQGTLSIAFSALSVVILEFDLHVEVHCIPFFSYCRN